MEKNVERINRLIAGEKYRNGREKAGFYKFFQQLKEKNSDKSE